MVDNISDLRKICQTPLDQYPIPIRIIRTISIYFTKALLHLSFEANQVTILWMVLGILSGYMFCFGTKFSYILASLLNIISLILDYSDGEVARYTQSASKLGIFFEGIAHDVSDPLCLLLGISIGLYSEYDNITFVYFGISSTTSILLKRLFNFRREGIIANNTVEITGTTYYQTEDGQKFFTLINKTAGTNWFRSLVILLMAFYSYAVNNTILFVIAIIFSGITLPAFHIVSIINCLKKDRTH